MSLQINFNNDNIYVKFTYEPVKIIKIYNYIILHTNSFILFL